MFVIQEVGLALYRVKYWQNEVIPLKVFKLIVEIANH